MTRIEEVAGLKYRLTQLQTQSEKIKENFFRYIENLDPQFNLITNINRTESTFDIYSVKLLFEAKYNKHVTSFYGVLHVSYQSKLCNSLEFDKRLICWVFDNHGNVKKDELHFDINEFCESFYVDIVNQLTLKDSDAPFLIL